MNTTMTVTFSFAVIQPNIDVVTKILGLVGLLDPSLDGTTITPLPASTSEVITNGQPKARKERAPLTEDQKEVVRIRFAKGRIAAAEKRGEQPRPEDLATIKGAGKSKKALETELLNGGSLTDTELKKIGVTGKGKDAVKVNGKAITPGTPEADAKIKAAIKKSVGKAKPATK